MKSVVTARQQQPEPLEFQKLLFHLWIGLFVSLPRAVQRLLQIILQVPVRINRGTLMKIVLASKFSDLCIELSQRKPQSKCHYQSENNRRVLQSRYPSLSVSPRASPALCDFIQQLGQFNVGRDALRLIAR